MRSIRSSLGRLFLAAALIATVAAIGCAGRVRVYDGYHRDYHRWNGGEDHAYRLYLSERHEEYRSYDKLDADHQRDYWSWRHDHPDGH